MSSPGAADREKLGTFRKKNPKKEREKENKKKASFTAE